jgi:hypothetical protein
MTSDKSSSALMDIPEIRAAYIDLRVCELRVLAAQTAVAFGSEERQRGLASLRLELLARSAMRRGDGQRRE